MSLRPIPRLLLGAALLAAPSLGAQDGAPAPDPAAADSAAAPPAAQASLVEVRALSVVGGADEEAARVAQLRGAAPATGYLLRSPSSRTPGSGGRPRVSLLAPEVLLAWNSRSPFSLNDGRLWAGRGAGVLASAGVAVEAGPVRLVLAPELAYSANAAFDTLVPLAWRQADPATYYPDWQRGEHSIDLPYRMGGDAVSEIGPGQSSLTLRLGAVEAGAGTENEWWGPGIRNALVLSNQGPGFGHLFARTARPLRTPLGRVEARWISGALRDSRWYARERGDDGERGWRSLSAAALVLSPGRGLSVGLARSVMAPADGAGDALAGGAGVLTRWKEERDPLDPDRYEQITSLFARLVMPEEGAEVYLEWARTRLPLNLRDLLEAPEHSQGYTLGLQWLRPAGDGDIRIQAETTYLEEDPSFAWRSTGSWYASATIQQGYTHEGQVVGASVGPGASQQWLAVDWLRGTGRAGLFVSRVRWVDDAYYDKPGGPNLYFGHDVSIFGGARGALGIGGIRLDAEYALERRWNVFFQNTSIDFNNRESVNAMNHTLRLRFSAAAPRLGR
ncbi:MAG TPA: capsule assembly Wzi family protein [Longimicrobium sp.]